MNINFDYPFKARSDFLEDIVGLLIKRRHQLELTQLMLNHKLGMTDGMIAKWETGIRSPTAFHLYCWADALDSKMTIVANDNTPHSNQDIANDNRLMNVKK